MRRFIRTPAKFIDNRHSSRSLEGAFLRFPLHPIGFEQLQLPTHFDPLTSHMHEVLFGFVLAAVAGFLLTAIANWTDRQPVRGGSLALLASLWLVGRIACLISADLLVWLAVVANLVCWMGAFGLLEIAYGPMLFKQRLTRLSSAP